jgi:hypothetical protein
LLLVYSDRDKEDISDQKEKKCFVLKIKESMAVMMCILFSKWECVNEGLYFTYSFKRSLVFV